MSDIAHQTDEQQLLQRRKLHGKSRVTNGNQWLPNVDGRSLMARRYRDIASQIAADQGGTDQISESRQQLIRRFSAAAALAEMLESKFVKGEEISPADHALLASHALITSTMVRVAQRIGVDRIPKDVQSLDEYLHQKHAEGIK